MGRFFMKEKAVLQKDKQTAFLCTNKNICYENNSSGRTLFFPSSIVKTEDSNFFE